MPHLVGGVHHLQQHGLLVHQLLRGVGVLCKEKGGCEDGLGCPIFSKAKKNPGCLGHCGATSALVEAHPPLMPPTLLLPETMLFWGAGDAAAGQAWLGAVISPCMLQAWAPTGEGGRGRSPAWPSLRLGLSPYLNATTW